MPLGGVLYESGDEICHVYFPTESIVSLLYVTADGHSAEIAIVGNDGIVGEALFMGGQSTPSRAVVQSGGHAVQLPGPALLAEFNRHHTIDQQLCRWLLLSLDRLPDNRLEMTQELIANMLGVRRAACGVKASPKPRANCRRRASSNTTAEKLPYSIGPDWRS